MRLQWAVVVFCSVLNLAESAPAPKGRRRDEDIRATLGEILLHLHDLKADERGQIPAGLIERLPIAHGRPAPHRRPVSRDEEDSAEDNSDEYVPPVQPPRRRKPSRHHNRHNFGQVSEDIGDIEDDDPPPVPPAKRPNQTKNKPVSGDLPPGHPAVRPNHQKGKPASEDLPPGHPATRPKQQKNKPQIPPEVDSEYDDDEPPPFVPAHRSAKPPPVENARPPLLSARNNKRPKPPQIDEVGEDDDDDDEPPPFPSARAPAKQPNVDTEDEDEPPAFPSAHGLRKRPHTEDDRPPLQTVPTPLKPTKIDSEDDDGPPPFINVRTLPQDEHTSPPHPSKNKRPKPPQEDPDDDIVLPKPHPSKTKRPKPPQEDIDDDIVPPPPHPSENKRPKPPQENIDDVIVPPPPHPSENKRPKPPQENIDDDIVPPPPHPSENKRPKPPQEVIDEGIVPPLPHPSENKRPDEIQATPHHHKTEEDRPVEPPKSDSLIEKPNAARNETVQDELRPFIKDEHEPPTGPLSVHRKDAEEQPEKVVPVLNTPETEKVNESGIQPLVLPKLETPDNEEEHPLQIFPRLSQTEVGTEVTPTNADDSQTKTPEVTEPPSHSLKTKRRHPTKNKTNFKSKRPPVNRFFDEDENMDIPHDYSKSKRQRRPHQPQNINYEADHDDALSRPHKKSSRPNVQQNDDNGAVNEDDVNDARRIKWENPGGFPVPLGAE